VGRHLRRGDGVRLGWWPLHVHVPGRRLQRGGPAAPFSVNQTGLTGGTAATSQATIAATGAGGVDTNLRGIGGDWSQCAYGVGMDISIRISNEASYYDGTTWHSAFQENLVLLLVEAYYGFVVGSKDAFVAYTKGTRLLIRRFRWLTSDPAQRPDRRRRHARRLRKKSAASDC
jgi:hypothetical protein